VQERQSAMSDVRPDMPGPVQPQPNHTARDGIGPGRWALRGSGSRGRGWQGLALVIAALIALPIAAVLWHLTLPAGGVWGQLVETVLPLYIGNTLMLVVLVGGLTLAIGVPAGWLVAACDFPGRRWLEWALMLPMAMPGYVIAYVYFDRLSYWGPVQGGLRAAFGWQRGDYWFPDLATIGGAAVLLGLVLYPYVYLLARVAFARQSARLMDAARALGCSPREAFLRAALPVAWPAIAAGAAFVTMETLADYGTVLHLGVQTLSTGIFRTWFSRGAPVAAAQLASLLLGLAALAFWIERLVRGGRRFADDPGGRAGTIRRLPLRGVAALSATAFCTLPVLLGFVLPAAELVRLSVIAGDPMWGPRFVRFALNSVAMASAAALIVVVLGLVLAYARRLSPGGATQVATGFAAFGYAMPGAVIALGVLLPLAAFDHALNAAAQRLFGVSTGLVLTGSVAALLFAYSVRFLAIGLRSIEASFAKIPPGLDEAARSLGEGRFGTLWRVQVPLLRGGMLSAAIFVFADTMKELPATLILRPFNFDTLAIRTFRLASDGRLEQAATSALVIVLVGLLPLVVLVRTMSRPD
jgi:iron(III) transport system permease protein